MPRPPGSGLPDDERPPPCVLNGPDDTRTAACRRHDRALEPLCPPCARHRAELNAKNYQRRKANQ